MNGLIRKAGMEKQISCDSAGTISYHAGEAADGRMQKHARRRGYELTSISRPVKPVVDFEKFDYIIGMDDDNMRDLRAMDSSGSYGHKMFKMTDFCKVCTEQSVPDPYYGGSAGFELVLDLLEDACAGLLEKIKKEL